MKKTLAVVAVLLVAGLATAGIYAAVTNQQQCPMQGKTAMEMHGDHAMPMDGRSAMGKCPMWKGTADTAKQMMSGCCPSKDNCPTKDSSPTKESDKPAVQKAPVVVSAVCPVMKNKIPDIAKAAGKSVYKGKTYYFCCAGCKPLFDKDPEKYIAPPKKS